MGAPGIRCCWAALARRSLIQSTFHPGQGPNQSIYDWYIIGIGIGILHRYLYIIGIVTGIGIGIGIDTGVGTHDPWCDVVSRIT